MKVLTLAILSLIIVASMAAKCRIFSCGSITNEGETKNCMKPKDGEGEQPYKSQICPKDKYCEAYLWKNPGDATGPSICSDTKYPETFPPKVTLVDNAALDGDYCEEDKN